MDCQYQSYKIAFVENIDAKNMKKLKMTNVKYT
jgi:hypothetical protein